MEIKNTPHGTKENKEEWIEQIRKKLKEKEWVEHEREVRCLVANNRPAEAMRKSEDFLKEKGANEYLKAIELEKIETVSEDFEREFLLDIF